MLSYYSTEEITIKNRELPRGGWADLISRPLTGIEGKRLDKMKFFSEIKNIDEVIFR